MGKILPYTASSVGFFTAQTQLACPVVNIFVIFQVLFLDMIQRLSKNVVKLLANNASPMTSTGTNCYLIGSGSDRILIDTGSPDDGSCVDALSKYISSNPVKISKIICTHWHPDHTGGVSSLSNVIGNSDLYKHPQVEYTVGRSYPNAGEKLPSGASYKLEKLNWNNLSDNDVINVEPGLGLEILFMPGHANDHICLWLEADNVLFSGDNILGGSTAVFDNYFEYMKSLIRIGSRSRLAICLRLPTRIF